MTETTQKPELMPCPFCGSEATIAVSCKEYAVMCNKHPGRHWGESCFPAMSPSTGFRKSEAEAISAWNTRASLPMPESEQAACRHKEAQHQQKVRELVNTLEIILADAPDSSQKHYGRRMGLAEALEYIKTKLGV